MKPATRIGLLIVVVALFGHTASFASADAGPSRPVSTRSPVPRSLYKPKPPLGEQAVELAKRFIGVPYRFAGATPAGFDCSGLINYVFGKLGLELPRDSYGLATAGVSVPRDDLRAGDLLFFEDLGHVGIYMGNDRMIHAPRSGKRVEIVRVDEGYLPLVGARRIVGGDT